MAMNTGIEKSRRRDGGSDGGGFGNLTEGSGQMLLKIRSGTGMWNHPPHLKGRLHSLEWAHMVQFGCLLPLRWILVHVESCKNSVGSVLTFSGGPQQRNA